MVRHALTLQQLLQLADCSGSELAEYPIDLRQLQVTDLTCDSREVKSGTVFVAIPGSRTDGHTFLFEAATAGAIFAIVRHRNPDLPLPQLEVNCPASTYSQLCLKLALGKTNRIQTAGITGTNGKTTTAWMLQAILQAAGRQTGVIGTICHHDGVGQLPSDMTTPDARVLGELFNAMSRQGTSHCAMEISSHALVQNRAAGLQLSAAALTNITQDHFDYHGDFDSYRTAKASIVRLLHQEGPLLLNVDDVGCQQVLSDISESVPVITCSIEKRDCEISGSILRQNHRSTTARLRLAQGDCDVRIKMVGDHNVSNCLIAAGLAEQMGVDLDAVVEGLQSLSSVPGRLERIDLGQPFQVFVDYAHTPDALQHCLRTLRSFTTGRVICVFGAGGDRDRSKRPQMGAAASVADRCFVTSDNPRSESPEAIIADIVAGISATTSVQPVVQRQTAIAIAIQEAEAGDTIVIAGRGHESMQEVREGFVPLHDAHCVRSVLKALGYGGAAVPQVYRSA
ncbi:MAG: UDP-N-acetylmuramoyl-L-alanyl-D-glutamate--2,6-diaminopimelate ligase [Fuerstiella sp.]